MKPDTKEICSRIDHTCLKPDATEEDIRRLCGEAVRYGFAGVCTNTFYLPLCTRLLQGTGEKKCVVIGFPLGAAATEAKVFEAMYACDNGADEIDMVINVGAVKAGRYSTAEYDIRAVREACPGKTLKVIIETGLLTDGEKLQAVRICAAAGADFVKTCTGFSKGQATVEDIKLIKGELDALRAAGRCGDIKIKASGGIRTLESALALIGAGADRLGASAGVAIAREAKAAEGLPED